MTIKAIMRLQPESVNILRKHGLDYLRCRLLQFEDACRACAVNPARVKEELLLSKQADKNTTPLDKALATTLEQHEHVRQCLLKTTYVLDAAIEAEQTLQYELLTTRTCFTALVEKLEMHLYKEEMILFPDFINLWGKVSTGSRANCPYMYSMQYPIERLEAEHDSAIRMLSEIRKLIAYNTPFRNGGVHYQAVCQAIQLLEAELKKLIDLENNILFREVLSLENKLEDSS
ncbi:MAG: hemerythrin domain-containing protein [Cyclobacteriaceae bacterium]|nr:hemerythrin domain-containing protein [Cyclobacteriaceae bacterium]